MNRKMIWGILLLLCWMGNPVTGIISGQIENRRRALLIIDVQGFYFAGGSRPLYKPEVASDNIRRLLDLFRKRGWMVVHVRHQVKTGGNIRDEVKPRPGEPVITKRFANSFRDTDLQDILQRAGIKELVICGMQTHMCVEAAVRAAADRGYRCTLVEDACATRDLTYGTRRVTAQDVHITTLGTVSGVYGEVTDTESLLEKF